MINPLKLTPILALMLLGGCVSIPEGPSVLVLPGTNKNFEQFRADDAQCRQFALSQVGGSAQEAANASTARSAAVGTVVGALAGAALGGGHNGAAVGAGTGLLFGATVGASAGQSSGYGSQRRYDNAFVQCMYAQGHRVPVSAQLASHPPSPPPQAGPSMPPPPPPQ